MRSRLNIVHLLAIANVVLLLAAAGVGWDMTRRYNQLVFKFDDDNAQKVADFSINDLAWNDYGTDVSEIGRNISQNDALRKALTDRNADALKTILADEFGRSAISSGQVKALGLAVYDGNMNLVSESWRGPAEKVPAAVTDSVAKRDGLDRLKIFTRVWLSDDEPRISAFIPVGGLHLLGYVAVHADPVHALASLNQRMGVALEIQSNSGKRLLDAGNFKTREGAIIHQETFVLKGPDKEPLGFLKLNQDVTDLTKALDSTALWSFVIFIVVCGGLGGGGVVLVAMYIRQVSRREAIAQAELDRQRQEKSEATEARQLSERAADAARRAELLRLADTFEDSVKSIVDFVSTASAESAAHAEALATVADRTSHLAGAAAGASDQAFENVHAVVDTSEELSASAAEITRQVLRSNTIAGKAVQEASETNDLMRGLAGTAQKIGEVVGLINAIASQTNLLALNATIEAARAGEAGKGFAVVASEVKSLATQTAKATEEISAQIGAIQNSTRDAADAIGRVGNTIAEISEISTNVAAAVEQQGAATHEITHNVHKAAGGARDAATNITGVREAAAETGRVVNQVLDGSRELARQADALHHEVERFLATVRAA